MTDPFATMASDLINDDDFSVDAVFYPTVGDSVSLKIWFDQDFEGHPGGFYQRTSGHQKTVEYLLSDIGRMAYPNEQFVFSGATYEVIAPIENETDGRFAKAVVK
jgi:hypothetical protein